MEINFDLLVSGCNTRCRHCYVNGGPGRNMPLDDALLCIEKLDEIAALLPYPASVTLDNEPFNHPDLEAILGAVSSAGHLSYFHHGMTTGIALMRRKDRDAVVRAYLDRGYGTFGITLHGSDDHHDGIVRREGARRTSIDAAEHLRSCGAEVHVSLMMNRFFPEDAEDLDRVLQRLAPSFVWFAVPNYTPHVRMMGFEPLRASLGDLRALEPWLSGWRQDRTALMSEAEGNTVGAVRSQLENGLSLKKLFAREQHELYLTVHPDGLLYLGNTGAETVCLGDLRSLSAVSAADLLRRSPGNRDYGAFYDVEDLPGEEELVLALKRLPQDLLYSDPASVICRGLAELRIPTRILTFA